MSKQNKAPRYRLPFVPLSVELVISAVGEAVRWRLVLGDGRGEHAALVGGECRTAEQARLLGKWEAEREGLEITSVVVSYDDLATRRPGGEPK